MKPKKCKACKESFTPARPMQTVCSPLCGLELVKVKKAKQAKEVAKVERAEVKKRKEALKTRADYAKEAQAAVNAWVRWRDKDLPCISCGRFHQGENHAGHYLSRGAHPELALDPRNISLQCQPCNVHLSGNQINYRKGLIARHGVGLVEWLEGPHEAKKYTVQELIEIRDHYRKELRSLKKMG